MPPRRPRSAHRVPTGTSHAAAADGLTPPERETFEALAARIWPGDAADPGAREAGVVHYLETALAGPYGHLVSVYRDGLADLNRASTARYGTAFPEIAEADQDALIEAMDRNALDEFTSIAPRDFLTLCIDHTMEGMFSDPIHGGNRDFIGWRAVGYPGPQGGYSAAEQIQTTPLGRSPRGLAGSEDAD